MKKHMILLTSTLLSLCACSSANSSVINSTNSLNTEESLKPRFNNISVSESKIQAGSVEVLIESLDSSSDIYYVLIDHNATAPTENEIKNGQNYQDVNIVNKGNGKGLIYVTIDSLKESEWYDFYCVLELNNTFSDIYKTEVLTLDAENTRDRGEGTIENPYRIETIKDLAEVASEPDTLNSYYVLMNDLDLSLEYGPDLKSWTPLGSQSGAVKAFNGTFDGKGHTISNLYINSQSEATGLFAQLGVDGVITNLNLENVDITSNMQRTGAVVGYSKGLISNINVIGGKISGTRKVGGAIGDLYEYGFCYKVYTDLEVVGNADDVGGVLGAVDAPTGSSEYLEVKNCYSKANVSGTKYAGGIVGYARCMLIDSCYAMGKVNGTENCGALTGLVQHRQDSPLQPVVKNCFVLDTEVTVTTSGGLVFGNKSNSNGGVDIKNVYYYNAKLTSPKVNSNNDITPFFDDTSSSWFKNTEEVSSFFNDKNKIDMDFLYAWEIKEGALRPTLITSSNYDNGQRG